MDHTRNRRQCSSSSSSNRTRSRLEFFKVFLPNFSCDQLLIPLDFVKQLKSRRCPIPDKTILEDRNGQIWNVHLMEEDDRLFIKEGWQQFVNDRSLEFGDFLLFRYFRKKSNFRVTVYGRNGCFKETPSTSNGTLDNVVDVESGDDEEEIEIPQGGEKLRKRPVRVCKRKFSDLNLDKPKNSGGTSSFKLQNGLVKPSVKPIKETTSVKCLKPKHPHFVAVIHRSTTRSLFIPASFLKGNGIQMKPEVILHDESGSQWPITIETQCKAQRTIVTSGLSEFWSKNLKIGDHCVLEFVLEQDNTCGEIRVQICGQGLMTERFNRYLVVA